MQDASGPTDGGTPLPRLDTSEGEALNAYMRRARTERHITLDGLVRATGLSQSALRKIEDGRTPNPGLFTLRAIWKALDLPDETLAKVQRPTS